MHQAAAPHWNQIARSQELLTPWAKKMFPLTQVKMDKALDAEEKRLTKESDPQVAAAYLKIMPLLWERTAISNYLSENPNLQRAIPPIAHLNEALTIARKDFRLTGAQLTTLSKMLKNPPN